MAQDQTLEILKKAILLESRGRAFYLKVAEQAGEEAVKQFFEMMADEEKKHVATLSDQYKHYQQNHQFAVSALDDGSDEVATQVLTERIKGKIAAAGFEAAAVGAAMAMEERAINLYATQAEKADDPQEKALYEWLAEWERGHLKLLSRIDREMTEEVWNDNQFWPF